jgi:glycosyltransferase involved in cell wall biosynthesis/SAM-dependent methyltransferase
VSDRPSLRVAYFGTYDRAGGRNAVLIDGLRAVGVEVLECHTAVWPGTAEKLAATRQGRQLGRVPLRQLLAWARLLRRHAGLGPYDLLLVGSTAHLDLPLAHWLARRAGRPLVFDPLVSLGETIRDRRLLAAGSRRLQAIGRLERALFALPDLVLADTRVHATAWAAELGLDLRRAAILPAGAPALYRRLARPYPEAGTAGLRVVYFGQYIPLHGVETVLEAAARLRHHPELRFELVGVGQDLPAARALAARLELTQVHFTPRWLPPDRLAREHIAPADLCLGIFGTQPKASRVVPCKLYAGLASGRPVVTALTPAVAEQLAPEQEVWTVPPGDPEALTHAILLLARNPALRARLAAAGQAAYDARFAPSVLGADLRELLLALSAAHADPRRRHTSPGAATSHTTHDLPPAHGADRRPPTPHLRPHPPPSKIQDPKSKIHPAPPGPHPHTHAHPPPPLGPRHSWRVARLSRALLAAAPPGPLADIGCGDGTLAIALGRAGRTVVAFDPDRRRLARARAAARAGGGAATVLFLCADATAIPLAGGSLAGVALGEVLEHIAADQTALAEARRVLAPGGRLALTVPAGAGRWGPADRRAGHLRRYDRPELAQKLAAAGLATEVLAGWGWPFGRLYDALVQRPALALHARAPNPWLARLAGWPPAIATWRALFAIDARLPAGHRGSGWLAVARTAD